MIADSGLNKFLASRGFLMNPVRGDENDGYISQAQKEQFSSLIASLPPIYKIAEIGLNGGQSADHFFQICKQLKLFVSFDINAYPCTSHAVEYLSQTYLQRFVFITGDSLLEVPRFSQHFPDLKFDLIYIDGCHEFEWVIGDLMNAKKIAHPQTILWIDDVDPDYQNPVGAAIKFCGAIGLIQIDQSFTSIDPNFGRRNWIQAKFI